MATKPINTTPPLDVPEVDPCAQWKRKADRFCFLWEDNGCYPEGINYREAVCNKLLMLCQYNNDNYKACVIRWRYVKYNPPDAVSLPTVSQSFTTNNSNSFKKPIDYPFVSVQFTNDEVLNVIGVSFPCGTPDGTFNKVAFDFFFQIIIDELEAWATDPTLTACSKRDAELAICLAGCDSPDSEETQEIPARCITRCNQTRQSTEPSPIDCEVRLNEQKKAKDAAEVKQQLCEYYYGKGNRYDDPFGRPEGRTDNPRYKIRWWTPVVNPGEGAPSWREAPKWLNPSETPNKRPVAGGN